MATAWVTEFLKVSIENGIVASVPRGLPMRVQTVEISDVSAAITNSVGTDCALVEISVDSPACWAGGAAPTATTDDCPIGPGSPFAYVPTGSHKLAFIERDSVSAPPVPNSLDFSDADNSMYLALLGVF